ncbi:hypothetical protein P3X46_008498 [Hevea brasiliensis]|uniref:Hexosyltransferase n=1 Tax=Hevea brasiliensis TaxID=3981 RepID=A0ABQ9MIS6_HEVBR|nr:putative UDP-glucuronate:xylan alpha-glucuronosyltransferase 5 [Hevea brasiliensis]KAJ9180226.1 hypothetical protein P3X46_008498 [Hevea brasiliensis]
MASSRPLRSFQTLLTISLFFLSLALTFLALLSVKPKPHYSTSLQPNPSHGWFDIVAEMVDTQKIRIGLVNVDDDIKSVTYGLAETVSVDFEPVSKEKKWEDFFPEWIDEHHKWGRPRCPEIPMPRLEDYLGLDVIVARVPCGEGKTEKEGIRNVWRLQVNLVVANLVVANGWVQKAAETERTVYVVFMGSCGPMQEIFRCDDLLTRIGDYWVYKPELRKLKQKMLMPVGSCQIAPPYAAEKGQEIWKRRIIPTLKVRLNHTAYQRVAYVTVLHSSEAYVCGAIALAQSIIQTKSTKDLVLLHDSSITSKSLRGLRAAGWKTRLIEPIRSPSARRGSYNEWNYSKLRVWQLTDYDKVIFIDADIIVLKNLDKFFVYPQLSASANDKVLFNSGIMVIEPSKCTFEDLMSKTYKLASYNGGDQGFLNEAFTWWHRLPSKLNHLKVFNIKGNPNHEIPDDLYTIHLLGLKPWMCYRDYDCNWDMLARHIFASDSAHRRWWHVYEAMPKKLQKYCGLTRQMELRIRKWRGIAKKANLSDGHWKINAIDPRKHLLI